MNDMIKLICNHSICRLVSTYLVHNGYSKTAEAFNGYTQQPFNEDLDSIKTRQSMCALGLSVDNIDKPLYNALSEFYRDNQTHTDG